MAPLSYRRHRFPPEIIQHAIWLYLRFTLSYRDVEELLAERGLDISYETVRRWVLSVAPSGSRRMRNMSGFEYQRCMHAFRRHPRVEVRKSVVGSVDVPLMSIKSASTILRCKSFHSASRSSSRF